MKISEILKRSRLTTTTLSQRSGVSRGFLQHLSRGAQGAGEQTRHRIAAVFRAHAAQLLEDAEKLERGPD